MALNQQQLENQNVADRANAAISAQKTQMLQEASSVILQLGEAASAGNQRLHHAEYNSQTIRSELVAQQDAVRRWETTAETAFRSCETMLAESRDQVKNSEEQHSYSSSHAPVLYVIDPSLQP